MTETQKSWLTLSWILVVVILIFGLPWLYSYEAIKIRAIDAVTGKPIPGVHVIANWTLESGNPGGNYPVGQANVIETRTGVDGVAIIPAWGPRLILWGKPSRHAPELMLYKSEYSWTVTGFDNARSLQTPEQQAPYWQFDDVRLKPLKQRISSDGLRRLLGASSWLAFISMGRDNKCMWTNLPDVIKEINREQIRLKQSGYVPRGRETIDQALLSSKSLFQDMCGEKGRKIIESLK